MNRILKLLVLFFSICSLSIVGFAVYIVVTTPDLIDLNRCFVAKMNDVEVCPGNSKYIKFSDISETLIDAIIVSEDAGFWAHSGLDWHELKESFEANLKSGRYKRGGSTITQQLVKNIYFSSEKTISRKIQEAILATRLEEQYSKQIILEKYLNTVEFGPSIYGVKQASNHFFSKLPSQLNTLESAYLAFLLPNPKGYYQYYKNAQLSEFAEKMVLLICKRLYFYKKITSNEYSIAKSNIQQFPWMGKPHSPSEFVDETLNAEDLEVEFQNIIDREIPEVETAVDVSHEPSVPTDESEQELNPSNSSSDDKQQY